MKKLEFQEKILEIVKENKNNPRVIANKIGVVIDGFYKQCDIPVVSNQREQLKHYSNFLYENGYLTKDNVLMEYEQSRI